MSRRAWILMALALTGANAQPPAPVPSSVERGVRLAAGPAMPGYTLFAPLSSRTTYLIDLDGTVVKTWQSELVPSAWVYMLDNGHVIRGGRETETQGFSGGGQGGRFQEFDFDGNLLWDYSINTESRLPHHDVAVLPNGNLLAVLWEKQSADEARLAGRRPDFIPEDGIWADVIVELEPMRPDGARIVWEWRAWDHIAQDREPGRRGFVDLSEHPELIDVNGDTVGQAQPPANLAHDVFHINSIAYNEDLDQILVSAPTFNEIWIIDHSTTTAEAAGSRGGRSGMGGDLLYRWGNPQIYGRGLPEDRMLGFEHDARWIPAGRPGAGNITVFSNRTPGVQGTFTRVYEIEPPIRDNGRYAISPGEAFGPVIPTWTYSEPRTFGATYISGAERLANGNTLITSGPQGRLFEVDRAGSIVWEYWSAFRGAPQESSAGGQANPYSIFRAIRLPPNHPAIEGRLLPPLDPQPGSF